jgi:hypothetical protein
MTWHSEHCNNNTESTCRKWSPVSFLAWYSHQSVMCVMCERGYVEDNHAH